MVKPLGYYSIPTNNSLITSAIEAWGEGLEDLNDLERAWMIYQLALQVVMSNNGNIRSTVKTAIERAQSELKTPTKLGLINALINSISY